MNKVRASMSLHKHSSNSISTSSSTYAMSTSSRTTSMVVTTSTTTRTTTLSTTTTTTSKPTTRAVRTTRPTTPSTTTTTLSTRATLPTTSSTQSTTRTTEPNTQIFRKHSSNNGLSNVISRGRDKSAMHATPVPSNPFSTPVAEDRRRITTPSTTTKHSAHFSNSRIRTRPTIPPQGKFFDLHLNPKFSMVTLKFEFDFQILIAPGKLNHQVKMIKKIVELFPQFLLTSNSSNIQCLGTPGIFILFF